MRTLTLTLAILLAAPWTLAIAEEPIIDEDDGGEECISLHRLRSTEIVDDRNILFRMSGGDYYHNILPSRCSGLENENRFSYRPTMSRLCRLDGIYIVHDDFGGLREGHRCRLGLFHKISKEDADAIKGDVPSEQPIDQLPMPEPQEPGVSEQQE